jgi:tetratricopeptide (TPR) repeat protein
MTMAEAQKIRPSGLAPAQASRAGLDRAAARAFQLALVVALSAGGLGAAELAPPVAPAEGAAAGPQAASASTPGSASALPSAPADAAAASAPASTAATGATGRPGETHGTPIVLVLAPLAAASRDAWVANGVWEGLAERWAAAQDVLLVGRQVVGAAAADLNLGAQKLSEVRQTRRLARLLGADWAFGGSLRAQAGGFELRLVGVTPTGESRRAVLTAASGLELESEAARTIARLAGAPADPDTGAVTASPDAWESWARAIALIDSLSRLSDSSRGRGSARRQLVTARRELESVLSSDPGFTSASAAAAWAAALMGDKAAAQAAAARAAVPDDARGVLMVAEAQALMGRRDAESELLERALALHPSFLAAHARQAEREAEGGRWPQALDAYVAYGRLVPKDAWLLSQRSHALAALHRRDEACAAAEQARELGGAAPALVREVAARYIDEARYDEAVKTLAAALRAEPGAVRLRVLLARAQLLRGNDMEAVNEGEKAAHALAANARADQMLLHLTLAHAWARLGQYDVAIEQLAMGKRHGLASLAEIESDPKLARFRADPRYPWGK